jgi:hypothetical protein
MDAIERGTCADDRRLHIDWRISLGTAIHILVIVAGGVWAVAMMSSEVNAVRDEMRAFKTDVAAQFGQLHADLAANTLRLDSRVDSLRDQRPPGPR